MLFKRFSGITIESIFFYACLTVSVGAIIFCGSFPTLDGPSHLYNARIADYIIAGNKFIKSYYAQSTTPVPNITDHYLLTLFCSFLSFASAEKLIQLICVVGFCALFRRLVWRFNPSGIGMSIFAIPFAFSLLYYLGFYNFCLSFPLLFIIILYYHKWFSNSSTKPSAYKYIVLSLISVVLYFTNALAFLFAGLVLFMFEIQIVLPIVLRKVSLPEKNNALKRLLLYTMVWIPGLIFFGIFTHRVTMISNWSNLSVTELFNWLKEVRPLIVYTGDESVYTHWFFYAMLVGFGMAIFYRIKDKSLLKFSGFDVFLLAFIFTLICYFVVPDGTSVGMMSVRLCIYLFVFFLLWLAMQKSNVAITWIIAVVVMCIHFMLFFNVHLPAETGLEKETEVVRAAGNLIEPNSVVLDIDVTGNWLYGHFGDYIAEDKPLVIIPNYEADDCWFGTIWNNDMPQIIYNDKDSASKYCNLPGADDAKMTKEIDYIFIHGDYGAILRDAKWSGVKDGIIKKYKMLYAAADSNIHIFSLVVKSTSPLPNQLRGPNKIQGRAL